MTTQNCGDWESDAVIRQAKAIELAAREAVREAILDHKRNGRPIVIWEDGQVRWIAADEINGDGTIRKR